MRCSRENSARGNFLRPGRKFQTASPSLIFNISQKSPSKIFTKFHQIFKIFIPLKCRFRRKSRFETKKRRILMRKAKVMIGKTIIIHGKWQKWHWPIPFNLILWYTVSSLTSDKKFLVEKIIFSIKIYGNFFSKNFRAKFFLRIFRINQRYPYLDVRYSTLALYHFTSYGTHDLKIAFLWRGHSKIFRKRNRSRTSSRWEQILK